MDKTLSLLFDYQRFEQNPRLQRLIRSDVDKYDHMSELSDDDIEDVWAAGDPDNAYLNDLREKNDD